MKRGFTLIELLIVIAIIAILALIAVPNFLEAQVRAKIARCNSDQRSVAVALESYAVDWGRAPIGFNEGQIEYDLWDSDHRFWAYNVLTTPTAYMSSLPKDPFIDKTKQTNFTVGGDRPMGGAYEYQHYAWKANDGNDSAKLYAMGYQWYLRSPGPAREVGKPYFVETVVTKNLSNIYDATNGTMSRGFIYRTNKGGFTGSGL